MSIGRVRGKVLTHVSKTHHNNYYENQRKHTEHTHTEGIKQVVGLILPIKKANTHLYVTNYTGKTHIYLISQITQGNTDSLSHRSEI